jgi:hypothetical protein
LLNGEVEFRLFATRALSHARNCYPTGKSVGGDIFPVNPVLQKYSGFQKDQIGCMSFAVPSPKGALAIVTDAGRDAMDADGAFDEQR